MAAFIPTSLDDLNELREYDIINDKEFYRLFDVLCGDQNRQGLSIESASESTANDENDGDENQDSENVFEVGTTETVGEDGIITRIIQSIDSEGRKIRTVQKIERVRREIKVPRRVLERRNLTKFGRCAGIPAGPESGVTTFGELVFFETPESNDSIEEKKKKKEKSGPSTIICRKCGEPGHWTMQCTYTQQQIESRNSLFQSIDSLDNDNDAGADNNTNTVGIGLCNRYVPPGKRETCDKDEDRYKNEKKTNLRITNLDEEATDSDLRELFSNFGKVKGARVIADRNTGQSRGFGYVDFENEEDALYAMEMLQRYKYGKQVLGLNWANPKRNK